MNLPGRAFYNVWEAAARWGRSPTDIIEWAMMGHFPIVVSIPRLTVDGAVHNGIFEVEPSDLLPHFPRLGMTLDKFPIFNVRSIKAEEPGEWMAIDRECDTAVSSLECLIRVADAHKFEQEVGLAPKAAVPVAPKHDWDGMWAFVVCRVHERGIPENGSELARECEEWFMRRDPTKVPDLSSIRKKTRDCFRALAAERA